MKSQDTSAVSLQDRVTSHDENMRCLNLAVGAFHKVPAQRRRERRPGKRDSSGQTLDTAASFTLPFGPHLSPVLCPREPRQEPERGGAVTAPHKGSERLTQSTPPDGAGGSLENSAEDHQDPGSRTITTNELLDCLVHPDVVARVTELLLDRHAKKTSTHTHTHTSVSEWMSSLLNND